MRLVIYLRYLKYVQGKKYMSSRGDFSQNGGRRKTRKWEGEISRVGFETHVLVLKTCRICFRNKDFHNM